jgi:hypothetical protein
LDKDCAAQVVHENNDKNNGLGHFNPWHYSEDYISNDDNVDKNKGNKIKNVSNFGIFYGCDPHNKINKNNDNDDNLISSSIASEMKYKRIKSQKAKSLQWRLVASKESAKMKESLSRESSQKNLPQINSENRKIESSSCLTICFIYFHDYRSFCCGCLDVLIHSIL